MRIVHVTGYYPPHLGGMEYRTKDLSENFAKRGYPVEVITSNIGCRDGKLPSKKNLRIQYLRSFEFAHTPIIPSLFLRLLLLPKDSVIHLHISQAILSEITYLVCKIRGFPYIAHFHLDVKASGKFGFLLPFYKRFFLGPVMRNADAVSVLTEDYKNIVCKKYYIPKEKVFVIPNGTYFKPSNNKERRLHKPIRLLFVGRLSIQKNIPLLIKAFHNCIYKYKLALSLQIAGDGEKKEEIRKLVRKLGLEKYVTMLGNVPPQEVQKLYNQSDVFILTSSDESFGTVIIEAMVTKTPVIATNIPAVRNIIKDKVNGLLVHQDPKDVAKAISKLIKDPALRKNLINNAFHDVKKYNWEKITDQYESVYRNIFFRKNR